MMTPSKEAVIDIFNYYIEQNNMYLMTQEEHKRYLEKDKQITQLTNNWNELEEWLKQLQKFKGINQQGFSWGVAQEVLDKMKEIKENSNEKQR